MLKTTAREDTLNGARTDARDEARNEARNEARTNAASAEPRLPSLAPPIAKPSPPSPTTKTPPPVTNPYKGNKGLLRAWHAMKNSIAGFKVAFRDESAFRQELALAAVLIPIGIFVPAEPVVHVLLISSVLMVLAVELLNSSVEAAIDRISLERHELSRTAKDLGSAAVMVSLGICLMTWGMLLGPGLLQWTLRWIGKH